MTRFSKYALDEHDFSKFAAAGGKLIITQGTGDPIIPHEMMYDYYGKAIATAPSESALNDSVRLFMPEGGGHSMSDWTGAMPSISQGMKALTDWVEGDNAPGQLPTVFYDFANDRVKSRGIVPMFNLWLYKKKAKLEMI